MNPAITQKRISHTGLILRSAAILFIGLSVGGCDNSADPAGRTGTPRQVAAERSDDPVRDTIDRSAYYLADQALDDGRFIYRINVNPKSKVLRKYNILRHAGSVYSLGMYYGLEKDERIRQVMLKTGAWLRDDVTGPIEGHPDLVGIWSTHEVNNAGDPPTIKLGGAGLGLVALMSIEQIEPGFTPIEKLRGIGRCIRFMQKPNGSFYSKYIPSRGGLYDQWESLYYPGEAALGLVMLYEKDPDPLWLETSAKAMGYLAARRKGAAVVEADHWALLATARLLKVPESVELAVSRDVLIAHAVQICESILAAQVFDDYRPLHSGGFTIDGRTTPTATRLEGLLAAYEFLPKNEPVRAKIAKAVPPAIEFLIRAQIRGGKYDGAVPRAVATVDPRILDAEDFNRRATEVRIDYVQHALSALIQYLELRGSDGKLPR